MLDDCYGQDQGRAAGAYILTVATEGTIGRNLKAPGCGIPSAVIEALGAEGLYRQSRTSLLL